LNSPIDSLVAGKTASAQAQAEDLPITGENAISLLAPIDTGDGTSSALIHRIRALRQRAVRASATP
jgi:hypothetical protein